MASTQTSLINNNFGGISRKDSSFSSELITCSDCQNVELYYTGLNSGVGIRTARGNEAVTRYRDEEGVLRSIIPTDEYVIEMFESSLGGTSRFIIYTENDTEGKIYIRNNITGEFILYKSGFTVTGNACGCDFSDSALDWFCFSNGENIQYFYYDYDDVLKDIQVKNMSDSDIKLVDSVGNTVKGLGLCSFDSRLWIFDDNNLWYSEQANCKNFKGDTTGSEIITHAGYITTIKPITAIHPYLGSLAVFHKNSSVLVMSDANTRFKQTDESPGGCASYKSLVFHGTDLYFYDDTKKGVFSFQQVVNGDKTLGNNIAYDIQEELLYIKDVDKIRSLSVVTSDRNEVWFLMPIAEDSAHSIVMIYDYIRGAWVKRKCQHINCMNTVFGVLYSGGKEIYKEYSSSTFDGEFISCYYTCTIFNLGADNTLKITKLPPRITASSEYNCRFWVQYIKNYNSKKIKSKFISAKYQSQVKMWNDGTEWNDGSTWASNSVNFIVKLPSITAKAIEIKFYTENPSEEFCFRSIEMSKIKVKQV